VLRSGIPSQLVQLGIEIVPMALILRSTTPVLLFHSVGSVRPGDFQRGLDHFYPDQFSEIISSVSQYFTIRPIDELVARGMPKGAAAITFDDAYSNVLSEALPILERFEVPATVFVNGATLKGKVLWRDKIRAIINSGLSAKFYEFCLESGVDLGDGSEVSVYRQSKSPFIKSTIIEKLCDSFLSAQQSSSSLGNYCVSASGSLVAHPLLSYGNHTENHYVLSSLSYDEQVAEIQRTHDVLEDTGLTLSRVLSIPFGGSADFNAQTLKIANEFGYHGVLLSRNQLNIGRASGEPLIERFILEKHSKPQSQLKRLFCRDVFSSLSRLHWQA